MKMDETRYERIARWLDGGEISLDPSELAAAASIRRDESAVGAMLSFAVSDETVREAVNKAMLAEVRRDEAAVAGLLDAAVPPGTLQRVQRRLTAALARPQRRLLRIGYLSGALAAAAAVLLAVGLAHHDWGQADGQPSVARGLKASAVEAVPADLMLASIREEVPDAAIELLAEEIDRLEAEMIVSAPSGPLDAEIEDLQEEVERFWLEPLPDDLGVDLDG